MGLSFLRWSHQLKLLHLTACLSAEVVHQQVHRSLVPDQVHLSHVLLQARPVQFSVAQYTLCLRLHCLELSWVSTRSQMILFCTLSAGSGCNLSIILSQLYLKCSFLICQDHIWYLKYEGNK